MRRRRGLVTGVATILLGLVPVPLLAGPASASVSVSCRSAAHPLLAARLDRDIDRALRVLGVYAYHFWMRAMPKIARGSGTQHLHRKSASYRDKVRRKIGALLAYNLAAAGEGELAGNDFAEDFASAQIDVATVG